MLFNSSETSFMFLQLLSCLPPTRMVRLQVSNCTSLLINMDAYCSFELFLIFQIVVIYSHSNYLSSVCTYNYEWFVYPTALHNMHIFNLCFFILNLLFGYWNHLHFIIHTHLAHRCYIMNIKSYTYIIAAYYLSFLSVNLFLSATNL